MPILPSRSCSSSPKPSCYTSYGCGRGPDTIIDKGRWRGGDNITRKSPATPPQAHRGDLRQAAEREQPRYQAKQPENAVSRRQLRPTRRFESHTKSGELAGWSYHRSADAPRPRYSPTAALRSWAGYEAFRPGGTSQ